jgi:hypothetical protein
MADKDENNLTVEVAKETTLLDMVNQLIETNGIQASIDESSKESSELLLTTNDVLIDIAKTMQSQLDLEKKLQLDKGRELDGGIREDDIENPFEGFQMPRGIKEMSGGILVAIANIISGFVSTVGKFLFAVSKFFGTNSLVMRAMALISKLFSGTKMGAGIAKFIKNIKIYILGLQMQFELLKDTLKNSKIRQFLGKIVNGIKGIATGFGKWMTADLTGISKIFPKVTKTIQGFMKIMGGIGRAATMVGKFLGKIFIVIGVVISLFDGVMAGIEGFTEMDGNIIQKLFAGLMGFITGFIDSFFVSIIDMIKGAFSWLFEMILGPDNPVSKFLDSFSVSAIFTGVMKAITNFFAHPVDSFMSMIDWFMDIEWGEMFMSLGTSIMNAFMWLITKGNPIAMAINFVMDMLKKTEWGAKLFDSITDMWDRIVSFLSDKLSWLPDSILNHFGLGGDKTTSNPSASSTSNAEENNDDAFYEKSYYGESSINKANIPMASEKQLQEIVDDNDLTEEDMMFVKTILAVKQEEASDDPTLAAIKSVRPEMSPDEAAQAKVNAAASKKKRDEFLASIPPEELARIKAEMGISTAAKPDTSHLQFNAVTGETHDTSKTYAGSVGSTDFSSMSPEEQSAYDEFKQIPEGVRRAEPHIQQRRTNPYSMGLRSKVETRKELRSYQVNPLIEAPTGGSAVNQGQALESGTNRMSEGKSKQQNSAPIVVSTPNNSQTTTNNVSNTTSGGGASPIDTHDPFSKYAPLGTSNW